MYDSTDSRTAAILLAALVAFGGVAPALAGAAGAMTVDSPANAPGVSSQAAAPDEVTECRSISEPGRYVLNGSITDTTDGACIFIRAGDVVLDGAGNTIDGDGGETGVGVSVGESVENVTVRDLTVTGFGTGVEVEVFDPRDVRLSGLTVRSNDVGVAVRQGPEPTGVGAQEGEGPGDTVGLRDSEIRNNTGVGVDIRDVAGVTVVGNDISANGREGVLVIAAADVSVADNTVSNNDDGIQLGIGDGVEEAGAPNATVSNNTVLSADFTGIGVLVGSPLTTVANNTVRGGFTGISVRANDAVLRGNEVTDNREDGISVTRVSGVRVTGGTVVANDVGIGVRDSGDVGIERVTARDNDGAVGLRSTEQSVSVSDLRIETGAEPVTLSFTGSDVRVAGVEEPPAVPSYLAGIGKYVRVSRPNVESADPRIDLSVAYADGETDRADESSLRLWRFGESSGENNPMPGGTAAATEWGRINESETRTESNTVRGPVRSFGVYAPLGQPVLTDGRELTGYSWTTSTEGDASATVLNRTALDLRVFKCSTANATADLGRQSGTLRWSTRFNATVDDQYWERQKVVIREDGEVVYDSTDTSGVGFNRTVGGTATGRANDTLRVDGDVSVTVSLYPSQYCNNFDHANTYLSLRDLTFSVDDDGDDGPEQPSEDPGDDDESDRTQAPEVAVSPDRLRFGDVRVGNTTTRTVTVRNDGESPLSVRETRIGGADADAFDVVRSDEGVSVDPDAGGGFTLGPDESREVTVRFAPSAVGDANATLRLDRPDGSDGGANVALGGRGTPNVIVGPVEFGRVATGNATNATLTVRNRGAGTVDLTAAVSGPDAGAFAVPEPAVRLGPGETREVTVRFAPSTVGDATARLALRTDGDRVTTAELTGTGALPGSRLRVTPERLSFLNVSAGETTTRTVTVENAGTRPLQVGRPEIVGVNASAFEVVDVEIGAADWLPGTRTAALAGGTAQQPGGFVLQPGEAREVAVRFRAPDDAARTAARLRFPTNDTINPQFAVQLSDSRTTVDVSNVQTDGDRTTVTVRVTDAEAGGRLAVDLSRQETEDSRVAVDRLTFTPLRGGNFTISVTNSPDAFATTPSFDLADGTRSAGYFRINTTLTDAELRDVAIRFRLRRTALTGLDGEPEDVSLYRFTDRWTELPTEPVAGTGSHRIFRALSSGFSDFSSGVKQAQFEIADARVTLTRLGTGEATEVITRVRNTGGADGTFTVRLQQGQQVVAQRELTIAPDGTRQATFDRSFDEPGSYRLFVNDQFVANVTVEGETTDVSGSGSGSDPSSGSGALPQPGMGVGTAVLAVLAAGYAVARRER